MSPFTERSNHSVAAQFVFTARSSCADLVGPAVVIRWHIDHAIIYVLPGYVIGADAVDGVGTTNRHRISTECEVTITTAGSYKVEWELLDPADTIMAAGNTVMGLISTVPVTQTVSGHLTPSAAQRLQVGVHYRVRARLVNSTTATTEDTRTQPTGKTYIHFTGTDPATVALNVVSEVTSITVDRRHLIETNANRRTIPVTVNYTLHRYDNWDAADDPRTVIVNLNTSLVRDDNNAVQPASVSGSLFSVNNVSSHATAGPLKIPNVVNGSRALEMDPTAILHMEWYRVESEITHQEVLLPLSTFTGNRGVSGIELVMHFTGELRFGALVTHFSHLNGAPTTIPTPLVAGFNPSHLRIAPDNNSGTLDGFTDYHYGDGTRTVNITLDNNGVATAAGDVTVGMTTYTSETIELNSDVGGDNDGTINGIYFKRAEPIKLDETGGIGSVTAYLPTGTGWREDRYNGVLVNFVDFADIYFNQSLEPLTNPSINPGPDAFYLCEETKPVLIECTVLEWDLASGEFRAGAVQAARSVRKPLMDFLSSYAGSYQDSSMVLKYSNDHLYNELTAARVKKGASGGGEMTTVLSTASNLFYTHFPFASGIHWSAALSFISIENDLIKPNLSVLNTASPVVVAYGQHCQEELERGCGVELGTFITLTSGTGNLKLTGDGGIHATGSVAMDPLAWGAVPGTAPQDFAQKVMTSFTTGNYLMAGTFLRGDQNPLGDPDGPGVILLSGFNPADLTQAERSATVEYAGGLADCAGMNFRVTGAYSGRSLIQGDPVWPYILTTRSKYYARYSGVTGIHEAQDGQFPGTATIGDYMFGFTKYGFAFLSNEQEESRTSGYLDLPDPTDFTLDFTNLRLSCIGALEGFDITGAGTVDSKEFDFWNALFTPYTARFDSTSDCDPGDGTMLVLGFSAHASHFADAFAGSLGIRPMGDFVTQNDVNNGNAADTVPTRLTLPGAMKLTGTMGESYDFFPAQGAYLNDDKNVSDGFWSLFGTIDVPFFKDMQVHLHAGCGSFTPGTPDPEIASPIYIMGGWPSNGWLIGGNDPFSVAVFDAPNIGFTNSLANYRKTTDNGNEQFLPRVQQEWLGGLINFDYPLKWSNTAFNFSGRGPRVKDLIVLTTQSELVYLDANNAELTFGARYEGLPTISLGNFVFNAIDDTTGISSAFVTAAGDKVFGALEKGVDQMAKTVSDRADDLLGQVVDALTADLLDDLLVDLKAEISTGGNNQADIELILLTYLGTSSQLTVALNKLGNNSLNADALLAELVRRLRRIEQSIDAVINQVTVDPETGVDLPVEEVANGLLKQVEVNGEFRRIVFEALSKELVDVLSTLVDASDIEEELAELIQEQSLSLDSVTAALEAIKAIVTDVRQQVQGASFDDLGLEIHDLVISPTGGQIDIGTVTAQVELEAVDIVLSASTQDLANLDALADEWRAQSAFDNSLLFTGTTRTSGAETHAWLVWQPGDPLFISSRVVAIYRKLGGPASPANYSRLSVVEVSADTRLIQSLLPVSEKMGQNLTELNTQLSEMYQDAFPTGTVRLEDKISAILTGAHGNAENMQRVILLGRQNPAIALCGGFAFADLISASGARTYELREFDIATGTDIGVLSRVTVDPASVLALPRPGQPVEIEDETAKGNLNVSMAWATPNTLRDLMPLQYGYDVYRLAESIVDANGWETAPPRNFNALITAGAQKVNRLAVLPQTLLSNPIDPQTAPTFLNDDNNRFYGGLDFQDGQQFGYFVVARDLLGRGGLPSLGKVMQIHDRLPPNPPQKADVRNDAHYDGTTRDQRLLVTWLPPELPFAETISAYYVYRWRTPHQIAEKGRELDPVTNLPDRNLIAILPSTQTSFRDDGTTAPPAWANVDEPPPSTADDLGKTYYYTIRAMDGSVSGNLSGHSAPAWGVLRDHKGPDGVAGGLRMFSRYPNLDFQNFTQVPLDHLTDDQGHLLFICTSSDPGLDWAEFSISASGNTVVKVGRAHFVNLGGTWTAALRITMPNYQGDQQMWCRVATKDGQLSDTEASTNNSPAPLNDRYLRIGWTATVSNSLSAGNDSGWRHDAVDLATGATNDVEGTFTPGADAKEYKVYRRVNNSSQTMITSGVITAPGPVTWIDPSPPASNVTICYFLQLFDEHGNGGELIQQGECIESGSSAYMPTPMLEPINGTTPLNPRMNVSWFCSTEGVERFEVWVARDSGNTPGNNGSGLSNDVAPVHPNELPLKKKVEGLDFSVFETGLARHLSANGVPHFSVTLPVISSDTYAVMIRAVGIGKFGERIAGKFSNIETFKYSIRTLGLSLPVPWPDRPLPSKADFHPGIMAVHLDQVSISPWKGNAVRIGEYDDPGNGTPIFSPDTNNPARLKIYTVPSQRDIEDYLYTNDLVAQKEPLAERPGLILPVALYRVQVANSNFPEVPGDIVQVSPMMDQVAQIEGVSPLSTTVTDPFIAILPRSVTGLPASINGSDQDIFLLDRQPVIRNARYKYFLVRFSPTKEIERVIVTNEVTVPFTVPTP
jgi:hypothetical protein